MFSLHLCAQHEGVGGQIYFRPECRQFLDPHKFQFPLTISLCSQMFHTWQCHRPVKLQQLIDNSWNGNTVKLIVSYMAKVESRWTVTSSLKAFYPPKHIN